MSGVVLAVQEVKGLFPTIEDYMWFQLALVRSGGGGGGGPEGDSPRTRAPGAVQPATLDALQHYLQQYPPAHYSHQGEPARGALQALPVPCPSRCAAEHGGQLPPGPSCMPGRCAVCHVACTCAAMAPLGNLAGLATAFCGPCFDALHAGEVPLLRDTLQLPGLRLCRWLADALHSWRSDTPGCAGAGKEPLLYTLVQLLSLQLQGAVAYLARDPATRAFRVDAVHLGLALHAAKLLDAGEQPGEQPWISGRERYSAKQRLPLLPAEADSLPEGLPVAGMTTPELHASALRRKLLSLSQSSPT